MDSHPSYYLIRGLVTFSAGLYFLRGAPLIIDIAYPFKDEEEEEETKVSDSGLEQNRP